MATHFLWILTSPTSRRQSAPPRATGDARHPLCLIQHASGNRKGSSNGRPRRIAATAFTAVAAEHRPASRPHQTTKASHGRTATTLWSDAPRPTVNPDILQANSLGLGSRQTGDAHLDVHRARHVNRPAPPHPTRTPPHRTKSPDDTARCRTRPSGPPDVGRGAGAPRTK